jgi:hypothetical protein
MLFLSMDQWGRCLYDHVRIPIPKPSSKTPQLPIMKMSFTPLAAFALILWAGSASAATLLLADHFNESTANEVTSSFNNNLSATQTGTLATTTYNIGSGGGNEAQHSNGAKQLTVANITSYGNVSVNNNFATQANAANLPLQISFNIVNVFGYAGDTTRWVQFNVGNSQNLAVNNGAAMVGVLFRVNGGTQTFNSGTNVGGEPSWSQNDLVTITLSGTGGIGSAFSSNGTEASVQIGSNNIGTFTLAQQSNAYLTFSAFNFGNDQFGGGEFDNLSVSLIPEPSAALLGGLGLLALLRRRRV